MICAGFSLIVGITCSVALATADEDPVVKKLAASKVEYDAKVEKYRGAVTKWFDKREDAARNAGDKKAVDLLKGERTAFEESGVLPKTAPDELKKQLSSARAGFEAALVSAVKELTKAKKDDEAVAVEMTLQNFRKDTIWKQIDSSKATYKDTYLQIAANTSLPTLQEYTGPVEIVVVARTEAENIRLRAHRGSSVIFNWEVNPRELRIGRPDGTDKPETGSLVTAKVIPLKPNTWYTLKWRLTEEGMQVSVDGRVVFEEKKPYDLKEASPIEIHAEKSLIDVKEFSVTPLMKDR